MAREIKFRGWTINGYMAVQGTPDLECLQLFMHHYSDAELMEFTGTFDKNGKEIYEGDILSFEGYPDSTIIFSHGAFGYMGNYGFCSLLDTNLSIAEVSGNIYEN